MRSNVCFRVQDLLCDNTPCSVIQEKKVINYSTHHCPLIPALEELPELTELAIPKLQHVPLLILHKSNVGNCMGATSKI